MFATMMIEMRSSLKNLLFEWDETIEELELLSIGCNLPDQAYNCLSIAENEGHSYFVQLLSPSDIKSNFCLNKKNFDYFNKIGSILFFRSF
jgi:hypothetical protein